MLLDITSIVKDIEGRLSFAFEENLEMLSDGIGTLVFEGPVTASGTIANANGMLVLTAEASIQYKSLCDRCSAPIANVLKVAIQEDIIERKNLEGDPENEERYSWSGHSIDLDPIVSEALLLDAPVYGLCGDDCKGICQQCGTNLNTGNCACGDKKPVDIRLAALEGFFKASDE